MKIRKAKKEDFKQYLKLVKKSDAEYSKLIGEKIKTNKRQIKKSFNESITSNKKILLIAENNKKVVGYLVCSLYISDYQKSGEMDYLFVPKGWKKKGIGKLLIKEFIDILKNKKLEKCRLDVNIKNISAINFYKKLGFKIYQYGLEKNLK